MAVYLAVKNWGKFQHYKNRNPPWIKLHVSTLNDRDFAKLSCASRGLLMQLWMLASENDGKIEYDIDEIKFRLRDESIKEKDVKALLDKGFLRICKQTLAGAVPETETETETETDINTLTGICPPEADDPDDPPEEKPKIPPCPHQEIIKLYHDILPELRAVKVWNETRRKHLAARWKSAPEWQDLNRWAKFFNYVRDCPFLMGQVSNRDGPPFEADLEWLVRPQNFAKVIEGKYERRN